VTILSDRGFVTQVAVDGLEALERLSTFNADVIVTDLVMPRMDGFELIQHLKEHGDLTPAIVLTAFGSIEKALSVVHELKAFWYLEKPVEPRAFRDPSETRNSSQASSTENGRAEARVDASWRTRRLGGNLPCHARNLLGNPAGWAYVSLGIDLWGK
jgi:DNA-binding NtrC family response regulator